MSECNHVWKVPLYGSSDMLRCEKCGKDGWGYEIANELEQQLAELREENARLCGYDSYQEQQEQEGE